MDGEEFPAIGQVERAAASAGDSSVPAAPDQIDADAGVDHLSSRNERGAGQAETMNGSSARLVGSLVHRALQRRVGLSGLASMTVHELQSAIDAIVEDEERQFADEVDRAVRQATMVLQRILATLNLRQLLSESAVAHELAFSTRIHGGAVVRGRLDCLVQHPDGRVVVLEFKTGEQTAKHAEQLSLYVKATQAAYGAASVEGQVIS